ncbi:MAG TPA: DeoR family transcriptional regulator [Candidatus Paceibacterota bacterium]|nr:DeoR family transcriptional regulator [Candidatus Paceibacterota bacterium]
MITERQKQLLDFIVREYVKSAEPVGSALVFGKGNFQVSPATIRNDMQVLENQGYLAQPHTSAGRMPTDKAYRWFVNTLLSQEDYDIPTRDKRKIEDTLIRAGDNPHELNRTAAQVLQELSDSAVIANIRGARDFYKVGLTSLLGFPEFQEFEQIFQLTSFFEHFDQLFNQVEQEILGTLKDELGFGIFIGRENPFQSTGDETVIVAQYNLPHRYAGSLTVIGPTRMDYRRNIGLVNYASQFLNKLASQK